MAVIGLSYLLLALCFLARLPARGNDTTNPGLMDGTQYLALVLLGIGWVAYRRDPLDVLGLGLARVAACPWKYVVATWLGGFVINRAANARVFRSDTRRLVANGTISPGGTYSTLADKRLPCAAILGVAMTGSQTFLEEFAFRGLLLSGAAAVAQLLGARPAVAFAWSVAASSVLFGLVHFVPARRARGLSSKFLPCYAFAMPTVLGAIFCVLNASIQSLWPGWLVHWWLNYSGFIWDRAFGQWEPGCRARADTERSRVL